MPPASSCVPGFSAGEPRLAMRLRPPPPSCAIVAAVFLVRAGADDGMVVEVSRGELTARLTSSGTLKPIQSITYRSPVPGRDIEIRDLAPEGSRVQAGDVLVRLDTTDLEIELARVRQEHRQAQMDLQVAEGEWDEAGRRSEGRHRGRGRAHRRGSAVDAAARAEEGRAPAPGIREAAAAARQGLHHARGAGPHRGCPRRGGRRAAAGAPPHRCDRAAVASARAEARRAGAGAEIRAARPRAHARQRDASCGSTC